VDLEGFLEAVKEVSSVSITMSSSASSLNLFQVVFSRSVEHSINPGSLKSFRQRIWGIHMEILLPGVLYSAPLPNRTCICVVV